MLTEEKKKALSITITKKEYERLIQNETKYFFYKEKFLEKKQENDELNEEVVKLRMIARASREEKINMIADRFDRIINEVELITDRKEIHTSEFEEGAHINPEIEYNNLVSYMRKLYPNDRSDKQKNYFFSRLTYDRRDMICPVCNAKLKIKSEYPESSFSLVDDRAVYEDMIFCGFYCRKCGYIRPNVYGYSKYNNTVLENKVISASTIADILEKKFTNNKSLLYQELCWKENGIRLSCQTEAAWIREAGEKWITRLYDMLHDELVKMDLIYSEAYMYRLHTLSPSNLMLDKGKAYYIWVYRTDHFNKKKIILFDSAEYNDPSVSADFLKNFKGTIQTCIPEYYSNLSGGVRFAICWQRVGMLIDRALDNLPESARGGSYAQRVSDLYKKLLRMEESVAGMDPDIISHFRSIKCRPIIDRIISMAHEFIDNRRSPDGIGFTLRIFEYILKHEKELLTYIDDYRIELDDGWCCNPAAVFTDGENGKKIIETLSGHAFSIKLYSVIKTIEANELNPTRYLTFFLKNITNMGENPDTEYLLPWNAPKECFDLFSD